ncbi:MAG: restriction endonuclease subunit S, partial [Gammaproteobacteria bacterium]|nr:restriction endonuclease subunit S [Gammaproteobacteria bacterium]
MNLRSTDSISVEAQQSKASSLKNTEVGRVPTDWEVVCLREVANFGGGTTPPRKNFEKFYASGTHPWVKTLDLNNGYISSTEENVTEAAFSETSLKMHPIGTVLVAMYGGFNQIGRTGLIQVSAAINQALVAVITKKERLVPTYLLNYLNYKVDYWKTVASSSRKDPNITSNDVKNFILPLPSVIEQSAIANALSDVDALIQELEKLIAKKQAIKTATMQQLLTGRTRLPQFAHHSDGRKKGYKPSELGEIPEDWEVEPIGSLLSITTGCRNTQDKIEEGLYPFFVRSQTIEKINSFSFDGEAVLTAGDGVGTGKIFHYINGKFDFHQRVYLMYNFGERVDGYFFYIFFSNYFYDRIMSMTAKSSVDSVRREMIADMRMLLPVKQEQIAIATILSEMDQEIQ